MRRSFSPQRRAFTLIELLVVIAIIAILIALLVPAVQKVREAASRTQCLNNMKQMGLALQSYHDVNRHFPPGAAEDQSPYGTTAGGGGWGSSWLVYILPYIEQNAIYSQYQLNNSSGYVNANNMAPGGIIDGRIIPIYRCPSSTFANQFAASLRGGLLTGVMQADYAGIGGVASGFGGVTVVTNDVNTSSSGCCSGAGISDSSGVLFANGSVNIMSITDGTSNTMVVGEVSSQIFVNGTNTTDYRPGGLYGFTMGAGNTNTPPAGSGNSDNRTFNTTTVRYPVNYTTIAAGFTGTCTQGVCQDCGVNYPISSNHPGGAVVLFCDGSVRFATNAISNYSLASIAVRNDGNVLDTTAP